MRELMGSYEYAYAMGHGCSVGWHPSFEVVRREVASCALGSPREPERYGESS